MLKDSKSAAIASTMNFPLQILKQCWFLAGPTASGKSNVGIALAKRIGAEIVSLDSMTLYRGMDIGTAKPDRKQRSEVPHHLIDVIEPHEEFSVAEYVAEAVTISQSIVSRGKTPLFVGGTGLYLRSVLRGVFAGPSADWDYRKQLIQRIEKEGADALYRELQDIDPQAAEAIHPNDTRRVIRALEVFKLTGKPLSEQQSQPPLPAEDRPRHVFWLSPPRDWLYDRINRRVESMVSQGLLAEVSHLLKAPAGMGRTARQALGYKEFIEHLENGVPLEETIVKIQTRTRQFAKRQYTWFRNLPECQPIDIEALESTDELAEKLFHHGDG